MITPQQIVLLAIGIFLGFQIIAANQYNVKFTKIECNYDAQYFDDVNCAVNPEDLTIDAVIKPEYTVDNLNVKVSIYRHTTPRERGRIFLGLNNVTIDICRFFSGKVTSNLMNVLAVGAQNCSNSFHPCPYAGHLYMRNCRLLDDSFFPTAVPAGQYTALVHFVTKLDKINVFAFTFRIYMTAKLSSSVDACRRKKC